MQPNRDPDCGICHAMSWLSSLYITYSYVIMTIGNGSTAVVSQFSERVCHQTDSYEQMNDELQQCTHPLFHVDRANHFTSRVHPPAIQLTQSYTDIKVVGFTL